MSQLKIRLDVAIQKSDQADRLYCVSYNVDPRLLYQLFWPQERCQDIAFDAIFCTRVLL